MIRLGLRLTLRGGKEAAVRLAITAAAVALGVGLLLIALAGMNALTAQNNRTAWLNTSGPGFAGGPGIVNSAPDGATPSTADPLWWLSNTDHFGSQTIYRIDVAATGSHSPVPPGMAHLPGPGQFFASPALTRLLRATPATELGDRFAGTQIGTIGASALPSPNSLIIVVGHTAAELSQVPGAGEVLNIDSDIKHSGGPNGWDANKLQTILAVGAMGLLFPVLIFIATATRLSAARREQRFAAMRLVGATPRQVSVISAVEASVAAVAGVIVGFGVFFLLRPVLTSVPFTGAPFAPGDLSLGLVDILLVVVGVPIAAVAAARVAMRRVQISPLGVTRRVTPPAPRAYRLLPLVAGVAELAYFVEVGRPKSTGGQIEAYTSGCLLMMAGLVIAGPWLTMVGSRLIVGRSGRPSVIIAGRRLSDNPRGGFRAISGLIVALFATSVSVGIITTILADNGSAITGAAARATLFDQLGPDSGPPSQAPDASQPVVVPGALLSQLAAIGHVQGVTLLYSAPVTNPDVRSDNVTVLALCDQLARTPALGRCAAGAQVARITASFDSTRVAGQPTLAQTVWPAVPATLQSVQSLPILAIVVGTDGSRARPSNEPAPTSSWRIPREVPRRSASSAPTTPGASPSSST